VEHVNVKTSIAIVQYMQEYAVLIVCLDLIA